MPLSVMLLLPALWLLPAAPTARTAPAAPAAPNDDVVEVANLQFRSDPLYNLHHVLYAAAWARRTAAGARFSNAGALPAPLDAPFTDDERKIWISAIDYYDKNLASDALLSQKMIGVKDALAFGTLDSDDVGKDLREVLTATLPIYTRHFWPAHDRANREWIAATSARLREIAPAVTPRLAKLYRLPWFTAPVRVDVVWVGNRAGGYTTVGPPPHATLLSRDPNCVGWTAVEMVFHETSHALIQPIEARLAQALGDRIKEDGVLWHVVQFYVAGAVVKDVLRALGIDYTPYLYSTGLFDRAWPRYRPAVEANWQPYVDGKITLDDAVAGTIKMLPPAAKP
jgi:hypothetical protein